MSEVRDTYYKYKDGGDIRGDKEIFENYVIELESEKMELLEELERIIEQEKIDCNLNLDKYRG